MTNQTVDIGTTRNEDEGTKSGGGGSEFGDESGDEEEVG